MAKEELECSFCGRKKPETSLLIAGLDAHICDRCIEQAHGIVIEESKQIDGGVKTFQPVPDFSPVFPYTLTALDTDFFYGLDSNMRCIIITCACLRRYFIVFFIKVSYESVGFRPSDTRHIRRHEINTV